MSANLPINLRVLIHQKTFAALRTLPSPVPAFDYDQRAFTVDQIKAAATEAGFQVGNCRPVLMLRDAMRRSGMRLA